MLPSIEERLAELEDRVESLQRQVDADASAKVRASRIRIVMYIALAGAYVLYLSQIMGSLGS